MRHEAAAWFFECTTLQTMEIALITVSLGSRGTELRGIQRARGGTWADAKAAHIAMQDLTPMPFFSVGHLGSHNPQCRKKTNQFFRVISKGSFL